MLHSPLALGSGSHGRLGIEWSGRRIVPNQSGVLEYAECELFACAAGRRGGSREYSCDRNSLRQGSCSRFADAWLPRPGRYQVGRLQARFSDRGEPRRLDHLGPFPGFLPNERREVGRRTAQHRAAEIGCPRREFGVGKPRGRFVLTSRRRPPRLSGYLVALAFESPRLHRND